eukprot:14918709-Alexandrium_andersonii.AAC.1
MAPSTPSTFAFSVPIAVAEPGRSYMVPQGMRRSLLRPLTLQRRKPESMSVPNRGRSSTSKQRG